MMGFDERLGDLSHGGFCPDLNGNIWLALEFCGWHFHDIREVIPVNVPR